MPVSPAAQLFQNTQLANNPILSSILFLSQQQRDAQDRQTAEEQRQLENKQNSEKMKIAQETLKMQQAQQQQQLKAHEIAQRLNQFQFEKGASSIPEAITKGTIQLPTETDPIRSALSATDGFFSVAPVENRMPTEVQDPFSGEMRTITPEYVAGIEREQRRQEELKMAPTLLNMQFQSSLAQFRELGAQQRHAETLAAQEEIRREANQNAIKLAEMNNATRMEIAKMNQKQTGSFFPGLQALAQANLAPTGNLAVDKQIYDIMDGSAKQVFAGTFDPLRLGQDERKELADLGSRLGFVIPNIQPKQMQEWKKNKNALLQLYKDAETFVQSRGEQGSGVLSKLSRVGDETIANLTDDPTKVYFDRMKKNLETLKTSVGSVGVQSDQDILRYEGALPSFGMSTKNMNNQLAALRREIQAAEDAFLGSIPEEQRKFMFAANGIPETPGTQYDSAKRLLEEE